MSELRITKGALAPACCLPNPNPLVAKPPAPVHRWSFTGDAGDSIGGAHGVVVDGGPATANFTDGQLDLSANRGQRSDANLDDAYVDLPNGLLKKMNGKVSIRAGLPPPGRSVGRACLTSAAAVAGRMSPGPAIVRRPVTSCSPPSVLEREVLEIPLKSSDRARVRAHGDANAGILQALEIRLGVVEGRRDTSLPLPCDSSPDTQVSAGPRSSRPAPPA